MTDAAAACPDPCQDPRGFLRALFDAAVAAAQPARVMGPWLPEPLAGGRTVVLGAGKAAAAMAAALEDRWPDASPLSGLVVTRYGHAVPGHEAGRITVMEAAHPVPDAQGVQAARRILALAEGAAAQDQVVFLFSGGGSALLALPAPGVAMAEKRALVRELLASGAPIGDINCVRRHLSAVKGGRLAARCKAGRVTTLLISDVPGDAPDVIASGPTVADPTTCAQALAVLRRYRIPVSAGLVARLERGDLETPKPGDPRLAGHGVRVIATARQSLQAAAALARRQGLAAHVLGDDLEGEAVAVGGIHAALARSIARHGEPFQRPCVLLSGGETAVTIAADGPPPGRGGRASEFLLALALGLRGEPRVHALAADTDGIDGVGDNAGAVIAPDTLARAAALGLDAGDHLARHDAAGLFGVLGDLVVTGPTRTNVNDFRAVLLT